jgi:hypothetical protein
LTGKEGFPGVRWKVLPDVTPSSCLLDCVVGDAGFQSKAVVVIFGAFIVLHRTTWRRESFMSEETMVQLVQDALAAQGISEKVLAVGQFNPRGHSGGMFAGGLTGGDAGDLIGGAAGGIGVGMGSLAGMHAADKLSGLPGNMLVGVSAEAVYGFAATTRHSTPTALVFQVQRSGLQVTVHKRFNVRILELLDTKSGSTIELEGNRLPVTHAKDVIDLLRS